MTYPEENIFSVNSIYELFHISLFLRVFAPDEVAIVFQLSQTGHLFGSYIKIKIFTHLFVL